MTGRPSGRNWNPESLICRLRTRGSKKFYKRGKGLADKKEREELVPQENSLRDLWTSLGERTDKGGGECRPCQCRPILTSVMDDSADKSNICSFYDTKTYSF